MLYINEHRITYKPEEGEDVLRIAIDEDISTRLYIKSDFDRDPE